MSHAEDESVRDLQRVAAGTGLGLFGAIFRQGLAAITLLLLARLLVRYGGEAGLTQLGLIRLGISVTLIMVSLSKVGMDLVVTRFVSIYLVGGSRVEGPGSGVNDAEGEEAAPPPALVPPRASPDLPKVKGLIYGAVLWGGLVSVGLALAVTFLAPQIAALYHKPRFEEPLRAFVWWVPATVVTIILVGAVLARGSARARVNVRDLVVPVLYLLLAIVALRLRPGATGIGFAYTLSGGGGLLLALYYLHRFFPDLRGVKAEIPHRLLWLVGLPNLMVDLAGVGLSQADVVVLARLMPSAAVGIYGAAAAGLASVALLPLLALNQIIAPVISRLYHHGQTAELDRLLKTFTRLCVLLSVPVLALFVGLAGPLLGLLGKDFLRADLVLIIASAGILANVATGPVGFALVMTGYQWWAFVVNVLSLVALVAMIFWLAPLYGIVGAAIGVAISSSAVNLVRLGLVRRLLHVNPPSWPMLKSLLAGAVSAGAAYLLAHAAHVTGTQPFLYLAVADLLLCGCGLAVYVAIIWLLGLEPSDREAGQAVLQRMRAQFIRNAVAGVRPPRFFS
jgi:O-antigen/teichoic acid export membrane protein